MATEHSTDIALNHKTPKSSIPFWHDPGFRGALKLLNVDHKIDVVWYNLFKEEDKARLEQAVRENLYAFIFGKGCWHSPADKMMRGSLIRLKAPYVKTALFPACSSAPPPGTNSYKCTLLLFAYQIW